MATKPKTTDLLATWDETVVTVHMSVGKFRKMDEVYRDNRDLQKQIGELKQEATDLRRQFEDCVDEYSKLQDQISTGDAQAKEAQEEDRGQKECKEMLRFLCEGILASLDAEKGIAIKDPATLLSLFLEARAWLLKADENPSII
jgi:predicted  nucleic acid-binding Zn-ribbon protein